MATKNKIRLRSVPLNIQGAPKNAKVRGAQIEEMGRYCLEQVTANQCFIPPVPQSPAPKAN